MTYTASPERYQQANFRRTGNSGLDLPALSLGLWHNFGDTRALETQRNIVRAAFDAGITHMDLANNYGPPPGSAERNFGQILAQDLRKYRDELVISTKAGYTMWEGPYGDFGSRKYLLSSLDQSLGRMGLDYVDIFYHHRMDPSTPLEESMGALATAVTSGKALYVGLSNYSPEQTLAAQKILASLGVPLLIHQPRYSMWDRRPEESGLLDTCHQNGIGTIVYSPLEQGLLTDRYLGGQPENSRMNTSHFLGADALTPEYFEHMNTLNEIAQARGQSIAQLALAWTLRHERVTSAIIGASSVQQLQQNLGALTNLEFSDAELAAIDGTRPAAK